MSSAIPPFEYHESVRNFLNSPVPGEVAPFASDEEALQHGFLFDPARLADHDGLTAIIEKVDNNQLQQIPASFRADTVLILASMLGSRLGNYHLSEDEIVMADKLVFKGGTTRWLGLDIDTSPLVSELLNNQDSHSLKSSQLAEHLFETLEGLQGPSFIGSDKQPFLDRTETDLSTLGAKLLLRLLKGTPSEKIRDTDLELLLEHYEETGQVLLGTSDQFVVEGDIEKGSKAFWLLQLSEAQKKPISQKANPDYSEVVKFYEDGSKRIETYTAHNHRAKIIYEASKQVVDFADRRAEKPIVSIVAGYEQYRKIPYLPDWMKDSEASEYPATVLLDIYPDRYTLSIEN